MRAKFIGTLLALTFATAHAQPSSVTIDTHLHGGKLDVTALGGAAFAIGSLRVRGFEYLDCSDHGRCLQSASSFDGLGEMFNPTQAGGERDGALPAGSSSRVIELAVNAETIASVVKMAYWRPVAAQRTSTHVLHQNVMIGLGPRRNVIRLDVAFDLPAAEYHSSGQFEIATGYMPAAFSHFRTFDPTTGTLAELSDGPGEQPLPVIFCTADDRHCMGAISAEPLVGGGYGRWRFPSWACVTAAGPTGCVKWNAVTRVASPLGSVRRTVYTAVGSLPDIIDGLRWAAVQEAP
jgi:hypothetical protein